MTDGPSTIPAGWYPDPYVPGKRRYWDGLQWTAHYHPPYSPPTPTVSTSPAETVFGAAPVSRPKRRRGLLVGLIAGGTAVALGVTAFFVWGVPAITSGGIVTQDDWDYAYAPLQKGVEQDHSFEFPADYDINAMALANGDQSDYSFAFDVFTDAAMTRHADVRVLQLESRGDITVDPAALSSATYEEKTKVGGDDTSKRREFNFNPDGGSVWGLHEEYFLVQKLHRSGENLEKPIVHPFTVERPLEAPEVGYSATDNGSLRMEWDAVPGATEYLITVSRWDDLGRMVDVVGVTSDTNWSPTMMDIFTGETVAVDNTQNEGLKTYSIWSADDVANAGTDGTVNAIDNTSSEYEYGVVATDGTLFSSIKPTDANAVAASLPYEIPFGARDEQFPNGQWVDTLDGLPTRFLFTSLDGATRQTSAYIDPAMVTETSSSSTWRMQLIGQGTALSWPMNLNAPSRAAANEEIARFNARVSAEAPTTGLPEVTMIAGPPAADFDKYTPSTAAPAVDYPVEGSNEFTKYLAANLIAHEDAIDISAYDGKGGMPDLSDALGEAVYQNPYVLGYRGYSIHEDVVYVSYANDAAETTRLQAEVASTVKSVVASKTSEGMGDAEIAEALNLWLVETAEYDHAAVDGSLMGFPDGFEHAWDPSGVLLSENGNLGVCASYAAAYKALLDEAGVESVVVTGKVFDGGGHAWNKVQVEGNWLAVDPTWNDGPDPSEYLLISDAQFTGPASRAEDTDWMADLYVGNYATP